MRLRIHNASGGSRAVPLSAPCVLKIGADPACDIALEGDGDIPRLAAAIKCEGDRVAVVAPKGRTITVNDKAVPRKVLSDGDVVRVGNTTLRLEAEPAAADPLLGRHVGGYRIDALLGKGGMGAVYRAVQLSLNRPVALKIIPSEVTGDKKFFDTFLKEAQAIARLSHPNVVQIFDVGCDEDLYYFSMEYLPGGTLGDLIKEQGPLPEEIVLLSGIDAARALVWAEEQGIIHRDIKPDNLLITGDGTTKVADLGIALDRFVGAGKNKKRRWVGSPRFMAPEQALGEELDHRADIYALGSTLYTALTAKPLFRGKSPQEILRAKIQREAPSLRERLPNVSERFVEVLQRMVARKADDRYETGDELLTDLEDALVELRRGGAPPAAKRSSRRPAVRGSSRRAEEFAQPQPSRTLPVVAWSSIAVSVVAILVLIFVLPGLVGNRDNGGGSVSEEPRSGADPGDGNGTNSSGSSTRVASGAATGSASSRNTPGAGTSEKETTPTRTARRARSAADMAELDDIIRDYNGGFTSPTLAISRLRRLKAGTVDMEVARLVDQYLKEIGRQGGKSSQVEVTEELNTRVTPLLAQKKLREAKEILDNLRNKYPDNGELIDVVEKTLEADVRTAWTELDKLLAADIASGQFDVASQRLDARAAELPPDPEARKEREAGIADARTAFATALEKIAAVESKLAEALGKPDFAEALQIAQSIPEPAGDTPGTQRLEAKRQRLLAVASRARAAWERLVAAAKRRADARSQVGVAMEARPEKWVGRYTVKGVSDGRMTIESENARGEISVLDMSSDDTLSVIDDGDVEGDALIELLEGTGLLLLYNDRPFRSRTFLLDSRVLEERRGEYVEDILKAETKKLDAMMASIAARIESRSTSSGGTETWGEIADDAVTAVSWTRAAKKYDEARSKCEGLFVTACAEALRSRVPEILFHGDIASYKESTHEIKLKYDFTEPEQLEDFVPVLGDGSKIRLEQKTARVVGEFRFQQGNPFVEELTISGSVPSKGYTPAAPNICIALWTRQGEIVTPQPYTRTTTSTGSTSRPVPERYTGNEIPDDYFVFAIGYKSRYSRTMSGSSYYYDDEVLQMPGLGPGKQVLMPALAVLGGIRGQRLHTVPDQEGMWGNSLFNTTRGSQSFQIHMSEKAAVFAVRGKRQPIHKSRYYDRLVDHEPWEGSFSILTNGSAVHYAGLMIDGKVNPAWIDEHLRATAQDMLDAVFEK